MLKYDKLKCRFPIYMYIEEIPNLCVCVVFPSKSGKILKYNRIKLPQTFEFSKQMEKITSARNILTKMED